MNYLPFLLTVGLATGSTLALADQHVMDQPMTATTLHLADRYASLFYTVDRDDYKVVLAYAAASQKGEQLIRQVIQLKDGQSYTLSISGYGKNEQTSTISLRRTKAQILANVATYP